jgi:LmbE family N-acetylglucosaminyl deacetylase
VRGTAKEIAKWVGLGITASVAALYAAYRYQPQRYSFFPRALPDRNPPVDPDAAHLFCPEARVAVVAAHPDDPEFYIGGLLTQLGKAGAKILIVMFTDGDKGYYPPFLTNVAENRRVRRAEQLEAAKRYGAEVVFLAKPDGRLKSEPRTVLELIRELEAFQPSYVLSFDPLYPPRLQHSDHIAAGKTTTKAIRAVESVAWLMRFSTRAANWYADITPVWRQKRELIAIHKSQFSGDRHDFVIEMVGNRAKTEGELAGVAYAEGFRCSRLRSEFTETGADVKPKRPKRKPRA